MGTGTIMLWLILGGLVALVAWLYARHRGAAFEASIATLRSQIEAHQVGTTPELPPIVRTFAERAGGRIAGSRVIHRRHKASLSTSQGRPPIAITTDQWLNTRTPGFVWRAAASVSGAPVVVVDSYASGKGVLSARLFGVWQVAGGVGPDYDRGELMRYLSELPVHPDAILNNGALAWRQIDARTVDVAAESPSGSVTVTFAFDSHGDIVGMRAEDRPMAVSRTTVPTPWLGTYDKYRQFGEYRIPSYGEVGWLLPAGLFVYWRGAIVAYAPVRD